MGSKKRVQVHLTHKQIALLEEAVRSHPDLASRGSYLEAVMDGTVVALPYIPEYRETSGRVVAFFLTTSHYITLSSRCNELRQTFSAVIRQFLFAVDYLGEKPPKSQNPLGTWVRLEQRDALNQAVLLHPTINSQGEYLLAVLDGYVPRIQCNMDPHKGPATVIVPLVSEQRYPEIVDLARQNNQKLADFVHTQLFTQPRYVQKSQPLQFIGLGLRNYENTAIKSMIARNGGIKSFGELVSALHAGENIKVTQPVPTSSWKNMNTRIYMRAGELDSLRTDIKTAGDQNSVYLLKLLFGSDYKRTPKPTVTPKHAKKKSGQ